METQMNGAAPGEHLEPAPSFPGSMERKPNWRGARIVDKSIWFRLQWGQHFRLGFNPNVSGFSLLFIIAFILWCILAQEHADKSFGTAKTWITETFTWLYVGSQDIWAIVIIAVYFSKYGKMKLGSDDEKPEYNDGTWFAMLFACGVGVGLFFFGVAEPIWHYTGANRYSADKYMTDNELAQNAINLTFFHWGLHGWIVYVLVGMLLGIMSFRKGLPMTMKSCFYPLLGDRIFGWMGDIIDIFSIMTTLFGVCTSLGLGTMQVNKGMNFINENIEVSTENQVIIIWCITALATLSVASGVGVGIRRLSEICFGLGMVIMMMVFFLEDTWYLLNLYCQSIGYYFQWIIQLGFHCDAFEISSRSYGAEDRGRAYTDGEGDGPVDWMDGWTIFYWGWWISWSPFVGMFIAKVSKGRTLRQFINGTMTAPMIYSFLWLTIFGGAGIRTERIAAENGICCVSFDYTYLSNTTEMSGAGAATISNSDFLPCGEDGCGDCEWGIINGYLADNPSAEALQVATYLVENQQWLGKYAGSDDSSMARLSCMGSEEMWFALVSTYDDMGPFLCVISLVGIILYFVTSSDSGSLVIDIMSANGDQEPPIPQRIFWALVEGATATALLVAGGSDSLGALQTASVAAGLPYTIILCFLCPALWRALAFEFGDINPYGPDFSIALVDPITSFKLRDMCSGLKNIFLTPMTIYSVRKKHNQSNAMMFAFQLVLCWLTWVALIIAQIIHNTYPNTVKLGGIYSLAWVFYLAFATILTVQRSQIRSIYNINGNVIEDFFAALIAYPCVATQLEFVSKPGGISPIMPDNPNSKVVINHGSQPMETKA